MSKELTKYQEEILNAFLQVGETHKESGAFIPLDHEPSKNKIRENYHYKEGWLLQQDLKERTKVPETKIPFICNELKEKGIITEEYATYNYRKEEKKLKIRRIKRDNETIKKLFSIFTPSYLLTTQYYLNTPEAIKLVDDYGEKVGILISYFCPRSNTFEPQENFILAVPRLFRTYLESIKDFEEQLKKAIKPFKNKKEAIKFISCMGSYQNYLDHINTEGEKVRRENFERQYLNYTQPIVMKGYREKLRKKPLKKLRKKPLKKLRKKPLKKFRS